MTSGLYDFVLRRLGADGRMAKGEQSDAPGRPTIRPGLLSLLNRFILPIELLDVLEVTARVQI